MRRAVAANFDDETIQPLVETVFSGTDDAKTPVRAGLLRRGAVAYRVCHPARRSARRRKERVRVAKRGRGAAGAALDAHKIKSPDRVVFECRPGLSLRDSDVRCLNSSHQNIAALPKGELCYASLAQPIFRLCDLSALRPASEWQPGLFHRGSLTLCAFRRS